MFGRKEKHLIPKEKHKNVIRLEDRGKERELKFGKILFAILAVVFILYCAGIGLFMGYGTRFFLIWGVMGVGCAVLSALCGIPAWRRKIPPFLIRLFWICFAIGMALLIFVEGLVLSRCNAKGADNADYLIVLGAQWRTTGPSKVLKYRLDRAVRYLRLNPDTKVIVSGGQGFNEPISEAQGMYDYLVAAGVRSERILMEDRSTNTYENLKFCGEMLDKAEDTVVIVTNNFHVFRAEKLAKAGGYKKVSGLAAQSYPPMQVHNLFREFFGVTKDFLMGNLVYWERER